MAGLKKRINDKCKECIYDPYSLGTWVKQVEECTSTSCPLHPVRPQTRATKLSKNGKQEQPAHLKRS